MKSWKSKSLILKNEKKSRALKCTVCRIRTIFWILRVISCTKIVNFDDRERQFKIKRSPTTKGLRTESIWTRMKRATDLNSKTKLRSSLFETYRPFLVWRRKDRQNGIIGIAFYCNCAFSFGHSSIINFRFEFASSVCARMNTEYRIIIKTVFFSSSPVWSDIKRF